MGDESLMESSEKSDPIHTMAAASILPFPC
ncbi:hypothetical protein CCACVL1_06168 [Corchorus capsularis]|uniref:Uncharacterized protein n=1 Tax=Corchorus capsularis TaxID=210143 RepID=A0A1R3JH13_COCAP|nr:hypothetical protein CCACVL1_06168 [Corchorus capsularis]